MTYDVTLIPGDGIGPEITVQTVKILEATGLRFTWDEELAGMAAVEATGTPLPDDLTPDARWDAQYNPGTPVHVTAWAPVLGVIAALVIGATALMATIAFSGQRYFEWQVEESRAISQ